MQFYRQSPRRFYCWRAALGGVQLRRHFRHRHSAGTWSSSLITNCANWHLQVHSTWRWSDAPLSPRALVKAKIPVTAAADSSSSWRATSPTSVFQAARASRSLSQLRYQQSVPVSPRQRPTWSRWNSKQSSDTQSDKQLAVSYRVWKWRDMVVTKQYIHSFFIYDACVRTQATPDIDTTTRYSRLFQNSSSLISALCVKL